MTDEPVLVSADGPVRVITLNRPDARNAFSSDMHLALLAALRAVCADPEARAIVLTGAGRAFSAGGDIEDFAVLADDLMLRRSRLREGRQIFEDLVNVHLPVVAAVNGPAVGLGCSLVALSDIAYIAESAYLKDPHVQVGLVAADGGPLTWPLHTSLMLAKEYALTGAKITAARAREMGLVNHIVADPLAEALACAKRVAELPRQAVESTKRMLNLHLERAVLATLDYANIAEDMSFQTADFQATIARLTSKGD